MSDSIESVTVAKSKSNSDVVRTIKVMADELPSLLDAIGKGDTLTIEMLKEETWIKIIMTANVKETH